MAARKENIQGAVIATNDDAAVSKLYIDFYYYYYLHLFYF